LHNLCRLNSNMSKADHLRHRVIRIFLVSTGESCFVLQEAFVAAHTGITTCLDNIIHGFFLELNLMHFAATLFTALICLKLRYQPSDLLGSQHHLDRHSVPHSTLSASWTTPGLSSFTADDSEIFKNAQAQAHVHAATSKALRKIAWPQPQEKAVAMAISTDDKIGWPTLSKPTIEAARRNLFWPETTSNCARVCGSSQNCLTECASAQPAAPRPATIAPGEAAARTIKWPQDEPHVAPVILNDVDWPQQKRASPAPSTRPHAAPAPTPGAAPAGAEAGGDAVTVTFRVRGLSMLTLTHPTFDAFRQSVAACTANQARPPPAPPPPLTPRARRAGRRWGPLRAARGGLGAARSTVCLLPWVRLTGDRI
jgi:hypothetical protein